MSDSKSLAVTMSKSVTVTISISKSAIETVVNALLKYKNDQSAKENPQLLPEDDYFYLNLTLKKLPSKPRTNPYRIPLPHPVFDAAGSELCLIVDDRPRTTTPPYEQIKKLIKSQNIHISKVITISKLKSNYKPFEAKRKLCDSYNLFLVDKRVVHLLPKLLGKQFFRKKKLPLGVDLGKKNLKLQVERALGSALLYIRTGTCCVMKVGRVEMEKDDIVENVLEAIKGVVEKVPRKWDGVRSLHLKFSDSVALPIYQAMPDVRLKIEGLKERQVEISDNAGISGWKDAKSGKKKKTKGRIHEVRYMDVGEDVDSDVDDMDENERVRSEVDDEESKKSETEGKAQKEGVFGEINGKKRVKRNAKPEEAVVGKPKKDDKLPGTEKAVGKKRAQKNAKSEGTVGGKPNKDGEEPVEMKGKLGRKSTEGSGKKKKSVSAK